MGFTAAIIATVSTVAAIDQQQKAQKAQEKSAEEQRKARAEQQAASAQQAAAEKRQQIREERVKRARIIQASANTGTTASSGEIGSTASLGTQLGGNLGFNQGMYDIGANISAYNQSAADYMTSAQSHLAEANMWGQVGSASMSIFSASGGFKPSGTQSPAPVSTATPKPVKK